MMKGQLGLIRIISNNYKGNKLEVIQACINSMDTPINVRCCGLKAATANEAYLDMMRRTCKQFRSAQIIKSFHPIDIHSGQAALWLSSAREIIDGANKTLSLRMWNGRDILKVRTENVRVGNWFITGFVPEEPVIVRPDGYQEVRRFSHRAYTN